MDELFRIRFKKKMHLENRLNLFPYHANFKGLLLIHFFMLSPLLHIVVHIWLKVVLIYFIVCFVVSLFLRVVVFTFVLKAILGRYSVWCKILKQNQLRNSALYDM